MLTAVDLSPVESYVNALRRRDFDAIQEVLAQGVVFRALIPPGFRDRADARTTRELIQRWFGDADAFEMQWSTVEAVADRVHAGYRVRLREDGTWKLCEQHLFAITQDGAIQSADLICSGFRAEA